MTNTLIQLGFGVWCGLMFVGPMFVPYVWPLESDDIIGRAPLVFSGTLFTAVSVGGYLSPPLIARVIKGKKATWVCWGIGTVLYCAILVAAFFRITVTDSYPAHLQVLAGAIFIALLPGFAKGWRRRLQLGNNAI